MMVDGIPIRDDCKDLIPYLQGAEGHKHFYVDQNSVFCLRETCEGCTLQPDCDFVEDRLEVDPRPHPRRGIGIEDTPFLVLRPYGNLVDTLLFCEETLGIPEARKAYDEANIHFYFQEPEPKGKPFIFKGQFRFYGTKEEFYAQSWSNMFYVFDSFEPLHRPLSMDFSSIEPRVVTLICQEPHWIEAFKGKVKIIYREVDIEGLDEYSVSYVENLQGKTWCWLDGEIDKITYKEQCGRCPLQSRCTTVKDYFKMVSTDWHAENTDGLYPGTFREAEINGDKKTYKELRSIGKIVGLALMYGGTAFTVARNMKSTEKQAQERIDYFFQKLNVFQQYMEKVKKDVKTNRYISNIFGRMRDMSPWVIRTGNYREDGKNRAFAERTALNGPVQGSASEILKISQIYAGEFIRENRLHPLFNLTIPQSLDLGEGFYRNIKLGQMSSVHDESVFLIQDAEIENVIPRLYNVMQLSKITDHYGFGVKFELDVEFDDTRSWLSTKSMKNSKIFLLQRLLGERQTKLFFLKVEYKDIEKRQNVIEWFGEVLKENKEGTYKARGDLYPVVLTFTDRDPVGFQYDLCREDLDDMKIPYSLEELE